MALNTLLATFLCTIVLPVLLFLVALKLWEVYMIRGRDPSCCSPLPPGSMGLPFIGETLQLILQVNHGPVSHARVDKDALYTVETRVQLFYIYFCLFSLENVLFRGRVKHCILLEDIQKNNNLNAITD